MSEMELVEAVKSGNKEGVRNLIASETDLNQQDKQGWTVLNWAAAKGDVEMVELLLELGADPFAVGRDLRTPAMIALAAGQADVFKFLKRIETELKGANAAQSDRQYCKAYRLQDLRRYSGWTENKIHGTEATTEPAGEESEAQQGLSELDVGFLHQDYTVTRSMWSDEDVIFNEVTEQWKDFCSTELRFAVPDSLDLIAPPVEGAHAAG